MNSFTQIYSWPHYDVFKDFVLCILRQHKENQSNFRAEKRKKAVFITYGFGIEGKC